MDGSVMQSQGGGFVKKSKRRKKKRLKEQTVEKTEADTRNQLNDKSEAPDGIGDYRVASHESEMDILETGLIVKVPGADSTENISRGNASRSKKRKKRNKKAKIKDVVQSMDEAKLDQIKMSSSDIEGRGRVKVDVPNMDQETAYMDTELTKNLFEGNVAGEGKKKRKKKRKSPCKMEIMNDFQRIGSHVVVMDLSENLNEETVTVTAKRKKKGKRKAEIEDEAESTNKNRMEKGSTENLTEGIVIGKRRAENESIKLAKIEEVQRIEKHKMFTELTENLAEGDVTVKRKKRKKRKLKIKCDAEIINQREMATGSTENFTEGIAAGKSTSKSKRTNIRVEVQIKDRPKMNIGLIENFTEGNATGNRKVESGTKVTLIDEVKGIDQNKMDTGPVENLAEENVSSSRKRKKKHNKKARIYEVESSTKVTSINEVKGIDQNKMDTGPVENLAEENMTSSRKRKKKHKKKARIYEVESSTKVTLMDEVEGIDQNKMDTGPVENLAEENVTSSRKRKKKHKKKARVYEVEQKSEQESVPNFHLSDEMRFGPLTQPLEVLESQSKCIPGDKNQHVCCPTSLGEQNGVFKTGLITVSNKFKLDEVKGSSKGRGVYSTCNVKEAEYLFVKTIPVASARRKLLVLDINGLLADVVKPPPKHCRGDIHISQRAIFRRPFCDDFLQFCFQNFDVGIWSSRSREMIRIVKYLLGDLYEKLLFCWDMSQCTQTGFKTLENHHKPLVCKELRKIWEIDDPNLPWKKGDFDESNTLLVDDSPYKALLNPLSTAIFPSPYHYMDRNDTSLGPEGDIRVYLKKLAKSENVQNHVEQHPFGQKAIDEQNPCWGFYTKVLNQMSTKIGK